MSMRTLLIGAAALTVALAAAPVATAAPTDTPPKGKECWATHYGQPGLEGAPMANGQPYHDNANTAATSLSRSPQLPFGTKVKVTNVKNGKTLTVTITDRGTYKWTPQVPKCLDLTDGAFKRLGGRTNPDDGHIVVKEQVQ
jgi:rare lipoprotein A